MPCIFVDRVLQRTGHEKRIEVRCFLPSSNYLFVLLDSCCMPVGLKLHFASIVGFRRERDLVPHEILFHDLLFHNSYYHSSGFILGLVFWMRSAFSEGVGWNIVR